MRELTEADLAMARDVANAHGPKGDGEVESAAMNGLLEAAMKFDGRGTWEYYARQRCKWRVVDALRRNKPLPLDPADIPDQIDPSTTPQDHHDLYEALAEIDDAVAEELLDGVDHRRTTHKNALSTLRTQLAGG